MQIGSNEVLGLEDELLAQTVALVERHFGVIAIPGDDRSRMAAACFDVAVDHQKAILVLVRSHLAGSAFALARLLCEAFVRGIWLRRCADEQDLARFQKGKVPQYFEMIEAIERTLQFEPGESPLSLFKNAHWKVLNEFTHTGYSQVFRRVTADSIAPAYPDKEIAQIMRIGAVNGLLALFELASMGRAEHILEEVKKQMAVLQAATDRYVTTGSDLA